MNMHAVCMFIGMFPLRPRLGRAQAPLPDDAQKQRCPALRNGCGKQLLARARQASRLASPVTPALPQCPCHAKSRAAGKCRPATGQGTCGSGRSGSLHAAAAATAAALCVKRIGCRERCPKWWPQKAQRNTGMRGARGARARRQAGGIAGSPGTRAQGLQGADAPLPNAPMQCRRIPRGRDARACVHAHACMHAGMCNGIFTRSNAQP